MLPVDTLKDKIYIDFHDSKKIKEPTFAARRDLAERLHLKSMTPAKLQCMEKGIMIQEQIDRALLRMKRQHVGMMRYLPLNGHRD